MQLEVEMGSGCLGVARVAHPADTGVPLGASCRTPRDGLTTIATISESVSAENLTYRSQTSCVEVETNALSGSGWEKERNLCNDVSVARKRDLLVKRV